METLELIEKVGLFYETWGLPLIFLSSFIEITPFGFAIPGGLMLAVGGFFAYDNRVLLLGITVSGLLGTLTTFLCAYLLGLKSGGFLIKKLHQDKNASKAKHLLNNHGGVILTTSLLSSYTRFWIAYIAGVQKYNFFRFIFYAFCAAITWVGMNITIGFLAGTERENLEKGIAISGILGYFLVLLSGVAIAWSIKKEFKEYKGGNNENNST